MRNGYDKHSYLPIDMGRDVISAHLIVNLEFEKKVKHSHDQGVGEQVGHYPLIKV